MVRLHSEFHSAFNHSDVCMARNIALCVDYDIPVKISFCSYVEFRVSPKQPVLNLRLKYTLVEGRKIHCLSNWRDLSCCCHVLHFAQTKYITHFGSKRFVMNMSHIVMPLISWWRHQMETFAALLAICAGISPVTGEFPAQRPMTRNFDVFFDLRPNKRLSKQWWVRWFETPSRSYDVIEMCFNNLLFAVCVIRLYLNNNGFYNQH